jgi:hypothetical protein
VQESSKDGRVWSFMGAPWDVLSNWNIRSCKTPGDDTHLNSLHLDKQD